MQHNSNIVQVKHYDKKTNYNPSREENLFHAAMQPRNTFIPSPRPLAPHLLAEALLRVSGAREGAHRGHRRTFVVTAQRGERGHVEAAWEI